MCRNYLLNSYNIYNKYHKNKTNKIIHYITVPLIIFSLFCMFNYIPYVKYGNDDFLFVNFVTVGLIVIYITVYIIVDIGTGLTMLIPIYIFYFLASFYYYCFNHLIGFLIITMIHIASWITQILGHLVWEKNSPAFVHSFIQSFIMAPYFVVLELIFDAGYKTDLKRQLEGYEIY